MSNASSTFTSDSYVPILKCKQGELSALEAVNPTLRDRLIPLLEVRDGARQVAAIAAAWPDHSHTVFIHPLNVDGADEAEWTVMVTDLFDGLRSAGVAVVPVVTTDDSASVVSAIAAVVARDGRGVCIRLDAETLALAPSASISHELEQLRRALGLPEPDCDLVVDAGLVRDTLVARVTSSEAALRAIPTILAWRNVIVSFSAFPDRLADVAPSGAVTQLTREDALAFATLLARSPLRQLIFGDYGVGVPFYADIPWAPIPSIKYASADSWFIHRGATKANRSAQYVALATAVVGSAQFAGSGASSGDAYLSAVASGHAGPGNPTTYVRVATSRHMACVLDRLATLGVP